MQIILSKERLKISNVFWLLGNSYILASLSQQDNIVVWADMCSSDSCDPYLETHIYIK